MYSRTTSFAFTPAAAHVMNIITIKLFRKVRSRSRLCYAQYGGSANDVFAFYVRTTRILAYDFITHCYYIYTVHKQRIQPIHISNQLLIYVLYTLYIYKFSEQLFYGKCVLLIMNTAPTTAAATTMQNCSSCCMTSNKSI